MKKRFKLLFILLIILFPYQTKALTGNLSMTCTPNPVKASSQVKCTISGKTDTVITALSTNIKLSKNLSIESFELAGNWQGDDVSNSKIDVYTSDEIKSDFTIGTLTLKVKENTINTNETITLDSTIFYDINEKENEISESKTTIRVPNNVNTLSKLEVEGLTLTPSFDQTTTSYKVATTKNSINITATSTDSKATITGTGTKTLKNGKNNFDIIVTAEDGTKKTYKLEITANLPVKDNTNNNSTNTNTNTNTNTGSNSASNSDITNPKTGESSIIMVIILIAISTISIIYFKNKTEIKDN